MSFVSRFACVVTNLWSIDVQERKISNTQKVSRSHVKQEAVFGNYSVAAELEEAVR